MTPELKAIWTAALRSDAYKQTKGHLKDRGGYCCLGVACHILPAVPGVGEALAAAGITIDERDDLMAVDHAYESDGETLQGSELTEMPEPLRRLIDLDPDAQATLIAMNDGYGEYVQNRQTFAQIADWIDANL